MHVDEYDNLQQCLVREAQHLDAVAIAQLMQLLAEEEGGQSQLTGAKLIEQWEKASPPLYCVVAEEQATTKIVGAAIAYAGYDVLSASRGLHLSDIYLLPEYRKQGLGKGLLAKLASYAHSDGLVWMSWTVLKANHNAKMFYRNLGASLMDVDFMALGVTGLKQLQP